LSTLQSQELLVEKPNLKEASSGLMKKEVANMDMLQRARSFINDKGQIRQRDQRPGRNTMLDRTLVKLHRK